jgi:hypothetical protein
LHITSRKAGQSEDLVAHGQLDITVIRSQGDHNAVETLDRIDYANGIINFAIHFGPIFAKLFFRIWNETEK